MKITNATQAHASGYEYIVDHEGDVCIRPMHFENGIRQVRYYPDPCEFVRPAKAHSIDRLARVKA